MKGISLLEQAGRYGAIVSLLATSSPKAPLNLFSYQRRLPPLDTLPHTVPFSVENDKQQQQPYANSINVLYTNDIDVAFRWAQKNLWTDGTNGSSSSSPKVLGWDMESSPRLPWLEDKYRSDTYFGPATIQLSTVSESLVLQIAQDQYGPIYDQTVLPEFIHDILNDHNIIKTGVGIDEDMIELYRWCRDLEVAEKHLSWATNGSGDPSSATPPLRRFDIGGIGSSKPGGTIGLARLVAGVLGVRIPKSSKLARSHWSAAPLRIKEVDYAARDAWAAAAILHRLNGLDPSRFSPGSICQRLLDAQNEEKLRSIRDVSDRAVDRRAAKLEWKTLRPQRDAEGNENPVRTETERARFEFLTETIRALAPMQPISYEIEESLGLKIP
uniref:3'-5' exonuclease domain-containing protein n=1 Tax=Pseudo-nitzschia australis TaxID=44445 RepID=A0A7S4ERH4_9STRA|mmetsp:Transcript_27240/g.60002  ORF Transcript_27240/g.60002 Transcript_27240/m.60002 type:complete len:384 (+) Transcript_27240:87-1238(+)